MTITPVHCHLFTDLLPDLLGFMRQLSGGTFGKEERFAPMRAAASLYEANH